MISTFALLLAACSTSSPEAGLPPDVQSVVRAAEKPPVYPILKAHDWDHQGIALHEPFQGSEKPPMPQIGYGYNAADHYVFLTTQDGRPLDEVRPEALANLKAYDQARWEAIVPGVLTASGTDLSSEKILDPAFLKEAQGILKAKQILVGVPRRTVIYAVDAALSESDMTRFYEVFRYTWNDDSYGNAPITNLLFKYEDGVMVGALVVE